MKEGGLSLWLKIRFAIWKLTGRLLSSNLSMEAKHTIFAQKNVKNNLNLGPNSMRVSRKKAVSSLRLAIGNMCRCEARERTRQATSSYFSLENPQAEFTALPSFRSV
jgi:hypothetical protein